MEQQLASFYSSLVRYGSKSKKVPSSWLEAFDALINLLEEQDADKRQVIFIDELPWLDTPRSGFVTALEHFGMDGLQESRISCLSSAALPRHGFQTSC